MIDRLESFLISYKPQFYLGLKILFILILTRIIAKIFDRFLEGRFYDVSEKMDIDKTSTTLLKKFVKAGIYLIGIGIAIYTVPSLRKISITLFASAGFLGIVIGFAAQEALSNIIAGIFIAGFEPFRVGDNLTTREHYGRVEDITLRHTVLVKPDNDRVIIPNSMIVDDYLINHSILNKESRLNLDIGISYDSSIDRAKEIIREEIDKEEKAIEEKASILVTELADSAVILRIFVWGESRGDAWTATQNLRENIKKRFDKEGIKIPFPQRTVSYKKEDKKETSQENQEP